MYLNLILFFTVNELVLYLVRAVLLVDEIDLFG